MNYTVQNEIGLLKDGTHRFYRERFEKKREALAFAVMLSKSQPGTYVVVMKNGVEINSYLNGLSQIKRR